MMILRKLKKENSIGKDGFEISSEDIEILTENIEGWLIEI